MLEKMPDQLIPLDATEERAWRALACFFVAAPRLLDEDLQRGAHMSLSGYTILMHLSEAPDKTLRITEIANRAYLSGSRTTRLVDELITVGYATKQRSAADGRGFDVTLNEEGLAALERASCHRRRGSPPHNVSVFFWPVPDCRTCLLVSNTCSI